MILFILILLMIIISNAEIAKSNEFNTEYSSIGQTNVIKGIFVILVLLGHGSGYLKLTGVLDIPYKSFQSHIGQMVVSMFFFYSGFGMIKSIMKKRLTFSECTDIMKKMFWRCTQVAEGSALEMR